MIDALVTRHRDTLLGVAVVTPFVGFAVWLVSPVQLPFREIGLALASLVSAYLAILAGEWSKERKWKLLRLLGHVFTALGLVIMAVLFVGLVAFALWAKFNAPPSACMQCD